MQIAIELLDIKRYEELKYKPASLVPRRAGEVWLIREAPLETALSPAWLTSTDGEQVHIPLIPYLIRSTEPAEAMAVAFKFGIQAGLELGVEVGAGQVASPQALHICVGQPVVDLDNALRCWLGFAFLMHR